MFVLAGCLPPADRQPNRAFSKVGGNCGQLSCAALVRGRARVSAQCRLRAHVPSGYRQLLNHSALNYSERNLSTSLRTASGRADRGVKRMRGCRLPRQCKQSAVYIPHPTAHTLQRTPAPVHSPQPTAHTLHPTALVSIRIYGKAACPFYPTARTTQQNSSSTTQHRSAPRAAIQTPPVSTWLTYHEVCSIAGASATAHTNTHQAIATDQNGTKH